MGEHICTHCGRTVQVRRISYTVGKQLFTNVPVWVCTNVTCVERAGAMVYEHKTVKWPENARRYTVVS